MSTLESNIASAEGCRLVAYCDTVGVWTIGYGHTPSREGQTCTQDQADAWLAADIATAKALAAKLPEAKGLDPVRVDALTELIFNIGFSRWRGFVKCRAALADRNYEAASLELLNSKWATQVGATRSGRLSNMLLTGTYV